MTLKVLMRELKIYLLNLPAYTRNLFERKKVNKKNKLYRDKIIEEREAILRELPDASGILDKIAANNMVTVFNAGFEDSPVPVGNDIEFDKDLRLKYVPVNGKKLYYPEEYSDRHLRCCFRSVWIEQHPESPHLYLDEGEDLKDTVLFDCGSAEGNLPFMHIEELKHAYLFEGDGSWIRPLNATFAGWKDKVTIVNGFLGSGDGMISLGKYIEKLIDDGYIDPVTDKVFIKMDVEGFEPDLMKDISSVIKRFSDIRIAVCVYHKHDDERKVIDLIPDGFTYRTRPGYMFFSSYEPEIRFPYFRHGLLRIERIR